MAKWLSHIILFKIMGWRFNGEFPDVNKCVIAVIPHTHWMDFVVGVLCRSIINKKMHFIGKKALFKPPYGWFFRWMGGTPVDRSKNSNLVQSVAAIFNQKKVFRLALAPEGTRKKVTDLKTGFYYIALSAKVPIVLVAFDFGKKEVKFSKPFEPTGDYIKDLNYIRTFFKGVTGKIPQYSYS